MHDSPSGISVSVVPHAPVLIDGLSRHSDTEAAASLRDAVEALVLPAPLTVLVSPHAEKMCVYSSASGDLRPLGISGVAVDRPPSPLAHRLAEDAGVPVVDGRADHGIIVPLALGLAAPDVLAVGLPETAGAPIDLDRLSGALGSLARESDFNLVLSAHGPASLGEQSPEPRAAERGADLDDGIAAALGAGAGGLAELPWAGSTACGAWPFRLLGAFMPDARVTLLARSAPFGVGYYVATGVP